MRPSSHLRFVQRYAPAPFDMMTPIGGPARTVPIRVLQQWWHGEGPHNHETGLNGQWLDVQLLSEATDHAR